MLSSGAHCACLRPKPTCHSSRCCCRPSCLRAFPFRSLLHVIHSASRESWLALGEVHCPTDTPAAQYNAVSTQHRALPPGPEQPRACASLHVLLSGLTTLNSLLGGCSFKPRVQCCVSFVHVSFHTCGRHTFILRALRLLRGEQKVQYRLGWPRQGAE